MSVHYDIGERVYGVNEYDQILEGRIRAIQTTIYKSRCSIDNKITFDIFREYCLESLVGYFSEEECFLLRKDAEELVAERIRRKMKDLQERLKDYERGGDIE